MPEAGGGFGPGSRVRVSKKHKHMGELHRVTLGHDAKGKQVEWRPTKVTVWDGSTGRKFVFPCNLWLSRTAGQLEVSLVPEEHQGTASAMPTVQTMPNQPVLGDREKY